LDIRGLKTIRQKPSYFYEIALVEYLKIGDKVSVAGDELIVTKGCFKYSSQDGVLRKLYQVEKPRK